MDGWTYGDAPNEPVLGKDSNPGGGEVTYTYYTDSGCTTKTTAANGAAVELSLIHILNSSLCCVAVGISHWVFVKMEKSRRPDRLTLTMGIQRTLGMEKSTFFMSLSLIHI